MGEAARAIETAQQAARRLASKAIRDGYQPEALHEYQDADGNPVLWRIRCKHEDGDKWIRPMHFDGTGYSLGNPEEPANGWPLYRLPELLAEPERPVWFVEGENCVDALADLEFIATTTGSASSAKGADLSPLAGREVTIWPDNDEAGKKYAQDVADRLCDLGCDVAVVDIDQLGLSEHGDVVDWLAANPDAGATAVYDLPVSRPDNSGGMPCDTDDAESDAHQKQKPTITMSGLEEFLQMELPSRENLLSPWLPRQGLAMLYAPRGVGKTFVALNVAYAVASGGELFGRWQAPEPGTVVYLDGEMPASTMQARLTDIVAGSDKDAEPGRLHLITPDLQEMGMPNLSAPDDQALIDERIPEDTSLIVVDNLSTLMRSGKENEAESWQPVQTWALRHRAKGRSLLFIHHAGKGGAQRGTSRREDVLDTVISLKRPSDYSPDEGAVFEVHFEKARGLFGDAVQAFEARLESVSGRMAWTTRTVEETTRDRVIDMYEEGLSAPEIAGEIGVNKTTVYRNLRKAGIDPRRKSKS